MTLPISLSTHWTENYPLHWINLDRQLQRQRRMNWAIEQGGWKGNRFTAVDSQDSNQHFLKVPRVWQTSASMPGLQRTEEADPSRPTNRAELACFSSWQLIIEHIKQGSSASGWFLIMEDDVGSSLACPHQWPFTFDQLTKTIGPEALVIQLAPISSKARLTLHEHWLKSGKQTLAIPKKNIRSHGNGAILIHQRALPLLQRRIGRLLHRLHSQLHLLSHPRNVRPVADKWLYASLPTNSCWVLTYPLFCLDASGSNLHNSHIQKFHQPSQNNTLNIWHQDKSTDLIRCFERWSKIQ